MAKSVFVYSIKDDAIFREKMGNPDHVSNDVIYLLRIEDEEKTITFTSNTYQDS